MPFANTLTTHGIEIMIDAQRFLALHEGPKRPDKRWVLQRALELAPGPFSDTHKLRLFFLPFRSPEVACKRDIPGLDVVKRGGISFRGPSEYTLLQLRSSGEGLRRRIRGG
jgi:hypothetical protein